jgi:Ras-related C3 botulinum toxin substrate 1
MSDNEALLEWLGNVKWESYIDDEEVKEKVTELKEKIESLSGNAGDGEQVNIAGATRIKLVVVGDGAVGKTSLLISYATKKFPVDYVPTVFENYTAQMKSDNENILLHLWDTAGQEDYDRLRPLSYPGADVVLLCFSSVNRASYDAIREKWYPEVNHYVPNIPHLLVATKVDLRDSETADPHTTQYEPITADEGKDMAKSISAASYLEVSAKTRKGLDKVFKVAVQCVQEARGVTTTKGESTADAEAAPVVVNKKKNKSKGCILM